jgi:hypothetical protein
MTLNETLKKKKKKKSQPVTDIAVEKMSQRAPAHAFLSYVVGEGCKFAIEVCKTY